QRKYKLPHENPPLNPGSGITNERRALESRRLKRSRKKTRGCNFVELWSNSTTYIRNSDRCNRRRCRGRYRNDQTIIDGVMARGHRAFKNMPEPSLVAKHFFVKDASRM